MSRAGSSSPRAGSSEVDPCDRWVKRVEELERTLAELRSEQETPNRKRRRTANDAEPPNGFPAITLDLGDARFGGPTRRLMQSYQQQQQDLMTRLQQGPSRGTPQQNQEHQRQMLNNLKLEQQSHLIKHLQGLFGVVVAEKMQGIRAEMQAQAQAEAERQAQAQARAQLQVWAPALLGQAAARAQAGGGAAAGQTQITFDLNNPQIKAHIEQVDQYFLKQQQELLTQLQQGPSKGTPQQNQEYQQQMLAQLRGQQQLQLDQVVLQMQQQHNARRSPLAPFREAQARARARARARAQERAQGATDEQSAANQRAARGQGRRCGATTRAGKQCSRRSDARSKFCALHRRS